MKLLEKNNVGSRENLGTDIIHLPKPNSQKSVVRTNLEVDVKAFFNPEILRMAMAISEKIFKAQCFTKDVKNPEMAFVKIQTGYEMGMAPMQAMNSLYIVNGQVTIWGKAMIERLRNFKWNISFPVSTETQCKAIISKGSEIYEDEISPSDLDRIKKKNAYALDPKAKLRYHVISRLIRFYVPEVLGPTQYCAEEMPDYIEAEGKIVDGELKKTETNYQNDQPVITPTKVKSTREKIEEAVAGKDIKFLQEIRMEIEANLEAPQENKAKYFAWIDKVLLELVPVEPVKTTVLGTPTPGVSQSGAAPEADFNDIFAYVNDILQRKGTEADKDGDIFKFVNGRKYDGLSFKLSINERIKIANHIRKFCPKTAHDLEIEKS